MSVGVVVYWWYVAEMSGSSPLDASFWSSYTVLLKEILPLKLLQSLPNRASIKTNLRSMIVDEASTQNRVQETLDVFLRVERSKCLDEPDRE